MAHITNLYKNEFADFCEEDGQKPYFPPSELQSVFDSHAKLTQAQIDAVRRHFLPGIRTDIHFGFSSRADLNAAAGIRNQRGVFRINKGAVLVPADLFQRMLSHPNILKSVGNVKLENLKGQWNEGLGRDIDLMHESRKLKGRPVQAKHPNDPVRREFSVAARHIAYDFLVFHEIGHIVTGHLAFLEDAAGINTIYEAMSGGASIFRCHTVHQAIELAADNFAIGQGFPIVIDCNNHLGHDWRDWPEWNNFFSTPEQRLYAWCFSIGALFQLWGLKTYLGDIRYIRKQDYPPPAMRYFAAIGTVQSFLEDRNDPIMKNFKNIADKAFVDLNDSIHAIGGPKLKSEDIDPIYSSDGKAHFSRLRKCMGKLLPRFRKYSWISLRGEYGV